MPVCSGGMLSVCTDHATGAVYCGGGTGVVRKVRFMYALSVVTSCKAIERLLWPLKTSGLHERATPVGDIIHSESINPGQLLLEYGTETAHPKRIPFGRDFIPYLELFIHQRRYKQFLAVAAAPCLTCRLLPTTRESRNYIVHPRPPHIFPPPFRSWVLTWFGSRSWRLSLMGGWCR